MYSSVHDFIEHSPNYLTEEGTMTNPWQLTVTFLPEYFTFPVAAPLDQVTVDVETVFSDTLTTLRDMNLTAPDNFLWSAAPTSTLIQLALLEATSTGADETKSKVNPSLRSKSDNKHTVGYDTSSLFLSCRKMLSDVNCGPM